MANEARDYLLRQFDTAWALTWYHLEGVSTEECLWRPAQVGLHVRQEPDGRWRAEWPEHEGYDLGPPSIAWVTWHIGFWWSMVLDHSFGEGKLTREEVPWPGTADGVREWICRLQAQWRARLEQLTEDDVRSVQRTRWPFPDRPFGDVIAWANVELTKNASELGYARFLYAVRAR
ncbi:DinB family protein [Archangium violaceum]|uniref:DinB family protein n=1 Tax=Archangium violaceum TaxID=83451 RepID=UPI002B3195B8|nr:DinB family protein [Archangium gephyra]